MSKLFKLKEWLTIKETAQHLSVVLGETVEEKDIYRLALDGHLRLSVDFVNHAQAQIGKIVGHDGIEYFEASLGVIESLQESLNLSIEEPLLLPSSTKIGEDEYINLEDKVFSISGIWDLVMYGNTSLDIEHFYQQCTNGPVVNLTSLDGTYVRRKNKVAQIMDDFDDNEFQSGSKAQLKDIEEEILRKNIKPNDAEIILKKFKIKRDEYLKTRSTNKKENNYYPAGGLPSDSVLVIKTNAIMDFLQSLDNHYQEAPKPLTSKERNSLLILIGALCKDANIDYNQRGIASSLEKMTEILGAPVTDDTIRNILKQIDDAVILRSK